MKPFKQFNKTLMIVDALNLAFRFYHNKTTNFVSQYIKTVESLATSYQAGNVIIAADQGSSSYRKTLYPLYKQNRKDKFESQTDVEKLEFEQFFQEFTEVLEQLKSHYTVLQFSGVEADDIIAYIVSKKHKNNEIWIISSDKDLDLLITPQVNRFSYVTRKETTWQNWHEHYSFNPEQLLDIKCLTGDSGDNIPGVSGIGPKRAQDLVNNYGTIWDIISSIPLAGKYKYIEALNSSKNQLELNAQLIDLVTYCGTALGPNNCKTINNILENLK